MALKKKLIKESDKYNKSVEENDELLTHIAITEEEMSKAAMDIPEAWEKVADEIEKGNTESQEFVKGLYDVKDAFADVMDTSQWDADFMTENFELIKKAANGNIQAIEELSKLSFERSTQAYIDNNNLLTDFAFTVEGDTEKLGQLYANGYMAFAEGFTEFADSITIGSQVDVMNEEWAIGLNKFLESAQLTADQVKELFNGMGFIPDIENVTTTQTYVDPTTGELVERPVVFPQITNLTKAGFSAVKEGIKRGTSDKGSKKKDAKKASDEIDRYHVIKEQMEDISNELDEISKAKDRAFGGDKLKLMDDEIAKTEEMISAQEEYLRQIEKNYDADRAAIAAYGAKFDSNGVITNYEELMNAQIAKFNASRTDEAEEEYEKFKDLLSQYEETSDLIAEERLKLIDLENEVFDLRLEKLEYQVDLKTDVSDDTRKYLDFLMELAGDGIDAAADNIDNLSKKIKTNLDDIETWTDGLNGMFENRGYKGDVVADLINRKITPEELAEQYALTEKEIELMRDYVSNIMDATLEVQKLREEITEQVISAMEELNEQFDEQIEKLERLSGLMDHYRNIIDLVGADVLGISSDMLKAFDSAKMENSIAQVTAARQKMLHNEYAYNEAQAELEKLRAEQASKQAIEEQEKIVEAARTAYEESIDTYYETWESALELVRENFEKEIKYITDAFEEAMSGMYKNLEALQEAYDRQSEINERYLEDYEKIYELSKLNRDIGNSIDNTDNIKAKQELLKLQEEINALEESGAEISQYDLNFLRQKYELRLAEIALEEAQNAKSQVRMTRDSEGNWSYTYTADEDNISKAQQNYEDALYRTQQLTTDYIKDLEGRILQLNTDLVNALSQVDPNDAEGRQRIMDYYGGMMGYLTSQMEAALGNNAEIYNNDWSNYSQLTGYKISADEKFIDTFNETTLAMLTGYTTLEDYQNGFLTNSTQMYNGINDAAKTFQDTTEKVMNAAGSSIKTFAKEAYDAYYNEDTGFISGTKEAADTLNELSITANDKFDEVLQKVKDFNSEYDKQIQETIKSNQELIKSFNDLIAAESKAKSSNNNNNNNTSTNTNTVNTVETPTTNKKQNPVPTTKTETK